jgi:serine/threonine protein kinase
VRARALAAAWQKGVVHRDVKPSNIMFDENQEIKLVDFGVAHREQTQSQLTVAQEILGSPAYMAPEQARAEKVDHRADIYALGMTYFQLLTGQLPFTAKSPIEWMTKHATEPFPAEESLQRKIPQETYRIIRKMGEKNAADRYQTYAELISELESVQTELFRQFELKLPSATITSSQPVIQGDQLFEVLAQIAKMDGAGILKTRWGPLEKRFLILNGDVVLFASPQPEENIWKILVDRELLSSEQVSLDDPLEETLNRLLFHQLLSFDEFTSCYRNLMKNALMAVFRWPQVEAEYLGAKMAHDTFCKIAIKSC